MNILIALVVYNKTTVEICDTLLSLYKSLNQNASDPQFADTSPSVYLDKVNCNLQYLKYKMLIYDNSRSPLIEETKFSNITYVHDATNGGLASAYNTALALSTSDNDWLVLLDQDSRLPKSYFDEIRRIHAAIGNDESIVAIAPHIICKRKPISPCTVHLGGKLSAVEPDFSGTTRHEIMAINSGMTVRASFMKQIGGFNKEFWLDYLDHWLCHTIHSLGEKMYVSTLVIDHELSVSNYNQVSEQRAQNILNAEMLFYRKYKPWYEQILYIIRLLLRSCKQFISVTNKQIARNTMRAIWHFITIK